MVSTCFVDKNLCFGASISCANFQLFSDALQHIFEHEMGIKFSCTNYLDDFLFVHQEREICNLMVRKFLDICEELGVPVATEKTEWASPLMIFLGILIDRTNHVLCVPEEKRQKALDLLDWTVNKKKVTIKFIQRLSGVLNFLTKAIVPGSTFVREMYTKLKIHDKHGNLLKQYHHISLDNSFIQDCHMWIEFLSNPGMTGMCRPWIDLNRFETSRILNFFSDASASASSGGFGAILGCRWIGGYWGCQFITNENPSIEFLELFGLVAGILTWEHLPILRNTRLIVFCDNTSVRDMVNKLVSNCNRCMKLMRILTIHNLKSNRWLVVRYVKSK